MFWSKGVRSTGERSDMNNRTICVWQTRIKIIISFPSFGRKGVDCPIFRGFRVTQPPVIIHASLSRALHGINDFCCM